MVIERRRSVAPQAQISISVNKYLRGHVLISAAGTSGMRAADKSELLQCPTCIQHTYMKKSHICSPTSTLLLMSTQSLLFINSINCDLLIKKNASRFVLGKICCAVVAVQEIAELAPQARPLSKITNVNTQIILEKRQVLYYLLNLTSLLYCMKQFHIQYTKVSIKCPVTLRLDGAGCENYGT